MGFLFGEKRAYTGPTFGEPPIPPFYGAGIPGTSTSVIRRSIDGALVIPTVWACVGVISNAVSMLPLETFRLTAGVPSRATDPLLITSPAAGMTQSEWLHMLMVSLLLRGNAIGLITATDAMGRPTQIELQNPDVVDLSIDRDTGALTYKINQTVVPTAKIWHVRGLTPPGSKIGLSPIAYAAMTLGLDLNSRKFASDFLSGGGVPKAVLEAAGAIDQGQAKTIKDRFLAATQRREPVVLGAGVTYKAIQVSPEESQFLLTQQANVGQIARYFNLPAGMVGGTEGGSMTYSNTEQRGIDFLTYCVAFWLKRIEDAVFPLLPNPQFVKFNTKALLRTDAQTQATVDVILTAGRLATTTELRAERGLPPLTDAQVAEMNWVPQLTITPKGGAKAIPAPPAAPTEPAPATKPEGEGVSSGG